ncbi:unnamed protein product [Polarella glacialis]|uniref:Uncharacterized protein n=1 Tax=Polarella glacialis TaxID=89957 RepID=A0A813FY65_POLGL|nr:unnamed protein product [Polarella glacialis]
MPDKSRSRTPRRSPVAVPQDVESIEVDGSDASQDEDDQDEDDLGFEVDVAGDEGQRVKPCARRSLKQLSKTSLFVTEGDLVHQGSCFWCVFKNMAFIYYVLLCFYVLGPVFGCTEEEGFCCNAFVMLVRFGI